QQGYAFDVHLRLVVGRHAVVFAHGGFAGVVGSGGEADVAAEIAQQHGQIGRAAADVLADVESVGDAQIVGGARHQLHQSLRALVRQRARIERGFGMDHRAQQRLADAVVRGGGADLVVVIVQVQRDGVEVHARMHVAGVAGDDVGEQHLRV